MRKSQLSDEQLKDLLKRIPEVKDHRDPQEIYQNISIKMQKQKKRTWIVPTFASAAAILILFILFPNFNRNNDSVSYNQAAKEDTSQLMDSRMMKEANSTEAEKYVTEKDSSKSNQSEKMSVESAEYTALYEENTSQQEVFTFLIPDKSGQNMIPISIGVPNDEEKSKLELYKETMPKLEEEQWGLLDYYPLNAELSMDKQNNSLAVNVPEKHTYSLGINELAFTSIIKQTVKTLGLTKASLYTNHVPGINFERMGMVPELDISNDEKHAYFFYYSEENAEKPYIVPYNEPFTNIKQALIGMKENIESHGLLASIPSEIKIEDIIPSDSAVLTLKLDEDSIITDDESMIHSIEAILLTAKDFDFKKVKLQFDKEGSIGKFALNKELDVPLAPNRTYLP